MIDIMAMIDIDIDIMVDVDGSGAGGNGKIINCAKKGSLCNMQYVLSVGILCDTLAFLGIDS